MGVLSEENRVVIEPSDAGDVFMSVEAEMDEVKIENVDIILPPKQPFGIVVSSGSLTLNNVNLLV